VCVRDTLGDFGDRPARARSHAVRTIEYTAGSLRIALPGTRFAGPVAFEQPLEGSITYPNGPGPWKVLLFLHGNHPTCILDGGRFAIPEAGSSNLLCPDIEGPGGEQVQTRVRNYAGYGYLAAILASHGYAVVSPSADTVASTQAASPDFGATPRAEIIGATLDLMERWHNGTGPVVPGSPEQSVGTKLTGRLELQHVGLMGHSRGGEAVTRFLEINATRTRRYEVDGVVAVGPTDSGNQAPGERAPGTNWAVLLPSCDGDVVDEQGGNAFEGRALGQGPPDRNYGQRGLAGIADVGAAVTGWTASDRPRPHRCLHAPLRRRRPSLRRRPPGRGAAAQLGMFATARRPLSWAGAHVLRRAHS
jgi:hypothetical protein